MHVGPLKINVTPNPPRISEEERLSIKERDGNKCLLCGATTDLTVDHYIPRSAGGTHDPQNLRTLCRSCNSIKGTKVPEDVRDQPSVILAGQKRLSKGRCIYHDIFMRGRDMVESESGDTFREIRCARCECRAWVDSSKGVHKASEPFEIAHLRYKISITEARRKEADSLLRGLERQLEEMRGRFVTLAPSRQVEAPQAETVEAEQSAVEHSTPDTIKSRWVQTPHAAQGDLFCTYCQTQATSCSCKKDKPLPQRVLDLKIISGGQTGAGLGGLYAAAQLGVESGGYADQGWRIEKRNALHLAKFGLTSKLTDLGSKITDNVDCAHATIIFGDVHSSGNRLMLQHCEKTSKPVLVVAYPQPDAVWQIQSFLWDNAPNPYWENFGDPMIVNITGSRESIAPGIQGYTAATLVEALNWYAWKDPAQVERGGSIVPCECGQQALSQHSIDPELYSCVCGQRWQIKA